MSSFHCRLLLVLQRIKPTETESPEPIKPGRKTGLTQPSEKHPDRPLTGGNSILAAGLRHFKGPGRKRRWDVLSVAGARGSGMPIQTCPLRRAEARAAVASLRTHPCMAQRHIETLQMAVILVPRYLRMVLAGVKRSWLRAVRLRCPGGFAAGHAGWLSPNAPTAWLKSKVLGRNQRELRLKGFRLRPRGRDLWGD